MNYDINIPGMAKVIAEDMAKEVVQSKEAENTPRYRWRVPPSIIAGSCKAYLWYLFRWAKLEKIDGRMLQLFDDGAKAEDDFVTVLRRIGWTVYEHDPERKKRNVKNPQFQVKDFDGHLKGFLDGIGSHPAKTGGMNWLLEFKTFNTKRFGEWSRKGVRQSDPKYYGQVCLYMKYYQLPFCLLMGKNKDTSEIAFEVVVRNDTEADEMLRTVDTVINSRVRPARIAENPTHHKCKICPLIGVCHFGEPVDVSCRSCQFCYAGPNETFICERYGTIPGEAEIKAACGDYMAIK